MTTFIGNSVYDIVAENEMLSVLSHFDTDYIFNMIKDMSTQKYESCQPTNANVVYVYEQYFKGLKSQASTDSDIEEIDYIRDKTYIEIIDILCKDHNLYCEPTLDHSKYYTMAFYLYDFLIAKYRNHVVTFFSNFILREKNNLYESLDLARFKKNKDSSTIYNKKIFKNTKLAVIASNLEYIIDNISVFDISFETILDMIYNDRDIVNFLSSNISPLGDFFKNTFTLAMKSSIRPIILTDIRLFISREAIEDDININLSE